MQIFRLGQHLTSHAAFSQTRDCGLLQVQIYISLCEGAGEDTVISLLKETALYDSAKMKPLGEIWISAVITVSNAWMEEGGAVFWEIAFWVDLRMGNNAPCF